VRTEALVSLARAALGGIAGADAITTGAMGLAK